MILAGTDIATIIPQDDSMYKIEIFIPNREIAGINVGDAIKYKFDALPYKEYGEFTGEITNISTDAKVNKNLGVSGYYVQGSIENKVIYSYKKKLAEIKVGMSAEAHIVTNQKKIIHYLLEIVKKDPNWTLYKIYEDQDSGGNTSRPGFQSMIWDSYDNRFYIIIVKSISRFTRNTVDLLETIQKLRGLGIEVRFEQENISTSSNEQDLLIAVHTVMAQAAGESLSEAIKWGLRRGFETGQSKLYTRKCFGYKYNKIKELIIYEEQAIVVRMIFELYFKGYSVDMIMKELAYNNIKSPTGKEKWSKRTIQTILTNEKYIGNVILGKTYTGTYPNNKQKVNQGSQDRFLMKEAHQPIISKEMFEQVQEEMKRRSNIELVDGKPKRKNMHYSAKGIDESEGDE